MSPLQPPVRSGRQTMGPFGLVLLLGLILLSGCGADASREATDEPAATLTVPTATETPAREAHRIGPYPPSAIAGRQTSDAGSDGRRSSRSTGPSTPPVTQAPTSVPPRAGTFTSPLLIDPEGHQLLVSHNLGGHGFRTFIGTATPTPQPAGLIVFDAETGDRVRIDIPDETHPDHDRYHSRA